MPSYIVVDKNGNILKSGVCGENDLKDQIDDPATQEAFFVDTHEPFDDLTHRFDLEKKQLVEFPEQEKLLKQYEQVKNFKPPFVGTETDTEIDQKILDFYYGQVDSATWKKDNYAYLRKCFYPDQSEFIDAEVKLSTSDSKLVVKGSTQKQTYVDACLAVKARFPAPVLGAVKEDV